LSAYGSRGIEFSNQCLPFLASQLSPGIDYPTIKPRVTAKINDADGRANIQYAIPAAIPANPANAINFDLSFANFGARRPNIAQKLAPEIVAANNRRRDTS
jgi:hypothetical protein